MRYAIERAACRHLFVQHELLGNPRAQDVGSRVSAVNPRAATRSARAAPSRRSDRQPLRPVAAHRLRGCRIAGGRSPATALVHDPAEHSAVDRVVTRRTPPHVMEQSMVSSSAVSLLAVLRMTNVNTIR